MKKVLAIDMGATSIRGVIAYIENDKIITEELMRYSHQIKKTDNGLYWEWEKILEIIVDTIKKCGNDISAIGIDTWGVDFGLLGLDGNLLQDPMSYRSPNHDRGYQKAKSIIPEKDIFLYTGNQVMSINTLFQLLTIKHEQPSLWEKIYKVLMLPDLLQYILTNNMVGEETIWSTSQILNLANSKMDNRILEKLDLKDSIFPEIVRAGHITGNTKNSKIKELQKFDIKVISVCGHDTASALLLTESMKSDDCMFLSCGTWSLIGGIVERPIINEEVYKGFITNELGYDSQAMFFKNLTGLYIIERLKSDFEKQYKNKIDFDEITKHVEKSDFNSYIDVEVSVFGKADVDMKSAIDEYLKNTKQAVPDEYMDYFKIVYISLAKKYLEIKKQIEEITKKKFNKIHMIGGGAKSSYLCQLVADTLRLDVISGPYEATALGNILVQLYALGEIKELSQGLEQIKKEQIIKYYKYNK